MKKTYIEPNVKTVELKSRRLLMVSGVDLNGTGGSIKQRGDFGDGYEDEIL